MESNLGTAIRRARKRRHLTIQQVADLSGLSVSFISQVERDLVNPSVTSLQKVSRALGIQIGGFFEGPPKNGRVIRADERPRLIYPHHVEEEYLLTPLDSRHLQVLYYRLKPGANSGEAAYSHDSDEECGIVLSGRLEVSVAGETYTLDAGDAITFDSHAPHTWRNPGPGGCEALWVITPPGY
jgi:transcriptional regulator with XRE-family HTH domain